MRLQKVPAMTEDEEESVGLQSSIENNNEVIVGESLSTSSSPSLEELLKDAQSMRLQKGEDEEESEGLQSSIINVLSTIVTVDFFVVVGLLLWFLTGIFCAYVLKDDTIYLALAGIFEPVVQPALGILMIGSAASAVLKNKDNNE